MSNLTNIQPLEDFDWEGFEKGTAQSEQSRDEQANAYEKSLTGVGDHDVVDGTVIAINKREVVVNIGFKSDGIISANEFRYNPDLKVGDTVEVYIETRKTRKDNSSSPTRKLVLQRAGSASTQPSTTRKSSRVSSSAAPRAA